MGRRRFLAAIAMVGLPVVALAAIGLRTILGTPQVSLIFAGASHPSQTATPTVIPTVPASPATSTPPTATRSLPVDPNGPRVDTAVAMGNGVHGNALLLAGNSGAATTTYYWDGVSWRRASTPEPRWPNSRPVFDPLLNKTILISGGDMGNALETWAWDGSSWSNLYASPPGLTGPAVVGYDEGTKQLIMIASSITTTDTSVTAISSTWVFVGATWQPLTGAISPEPRSATNMAYDPQHRQLVLFGGRNFQNGDPRQGRTDTWTWDGVTWTRQLPKVSPPGGAPNVVYDPESQQLILLDEDANFSMWTWDGADWHQLHPTNLPPAGGVPQLGFDSANHQMLLFEGGDDPQLTSQTWFYDAGTWKQVA
jgi:hypothetical protein